MFDREQVYVKLNFKNVVDINDAIGIVNKQTTLRNGRDTNGTFTGMYKVLKVQSSFARGQFTQVLDLVRMTTYVDDFDALPVAKSNTPIPASTAGQPDSVKNNAAADSGSAGGSNTPPATDPKLIAAGNGPATNDPAQSSGAGTPKESSQPSSAAPANANDSPNAAPQEKAPDPQSDTVPSLAKLTADYDRLFTSATTTKFATAAEAKANGDSEFGVTILTFNERIQAARLNPDKATAVAEEIRIKIERRAWYNNFVFYTTTNIFDPAFKIEPKPYAFLRNLNNATGAVSEANKQGNESIEKLGQELKTLDPVKFEDIRANVQPIYDKAMKDAQAVIGVAKM